MKRTTGRPLVAVKICHQQKTGGLPPRASLALESHLVCLANDCSLRKSHEPTMATDLFLAGIQEQDPLPPSGLFVLLSACRWISFAQGDENLRKRRADMVKTQISAPRRSGAERVQDSRVLDSMSKTPRDRFVPAELVPNAYDDRPLPIGYGQTISQPYIVAKMTELLEPKAEHQVLEIGTGSGYQAAVLSPLVAHVYTIEIIEPLGTAARQRLAALGYKMSMCAWVMATSAGPKERLLTALL